MKGGILLALNYRSSRFTRDIDFSTYLTLSQINVEDLIENFRAALLAAVDLLPYEVDCLVHGWEQQPPGEDKNFPTIRIRVGYAARGDQRAHRMLLLNRSPHVVKVDFSLNEPLGNTEFFEIQDGQSIQIYSLHDLVAEKYRAILQQEVRNRIRRQDTYDIYQLLIGDNAEFLEDKKSEVLKSLEQKAEARNLPIKKDSMQQPEIISRSREDYESLEHEIEGPLPDFDTAYDLVKSYYESLPWD